MHYECSGFGNCCPSGVNDKQWSSERYHEKSRSIQYTKLHYSLLLTATIKHSDSDQKLHSLASLSKSPPIRRIAFQSGRLIKWMYIIWLRTLMGEGQTLVLFSAWVTTLKALKITISWPKFDDHKTLAWTELRSLAFTSAVYNFILSSQFYD